MLTDIYIEALLVNKELTDQVWEAWEKGEISDPVAAWARWAVSNYSKLIYTQFEKGGGTNCQVETLVR